MNKLLILLVLMAFSFMSYGQSMNIYSLNNGQMQAKGVGFSGPSRSYQVRFYKNNQHFRTMGTSLMGSFDFTSSRGQFKNGDILEVKVLNYGRAGSHYSRSATYRDSTGRHFKAKPKPLILGY